MITSTSGCVRLDHITTSELVCTSELAYIFPDSDHFHLWVHSTQMQEKVSAQKIFWFQFILDTTSISADQLDNIITSMYTVYIQYTY